MADGDRPIVLVPLATARKAARRAGVTLNLSADDIALAGKWKHGWIPLDAVASAVKAKRYHGGGEGRTMRGKGRAGSAVESRREPSRGRTKVKVGAPERATATPAHRWQPFNNGSGKHRWFLGSRDETLPVEQRYHTGGNGRTVRYASYESAQRAADRLHAKGHFPGSVVRPADPAVEAERAATRAKDAARQSDEARLIGETGSHDPKVWLAHRQEQTQLAGMNFTERERAGVNPRTKHSAKSHDATRLPNGEKMGGSNDHLTSLGQRNAIFRKQGLPEQEPGENKADHGRRVAKVIDERGRKAHAEYSARQRQSGDRLLSTAPGATGEAARARLQQASGGPRREPHISAEPMKDGRHKLTDSKSGESVKAAHLASFHSQGHTITDVSNGQLHTRDDYGKAHVYDPATGRAARSAATEQAQQVAQDRTRRVEAARGEPKLAELSDGDLRQLINTYGIRSPQAEAARAELSRREHDGSRSRIQVRPAVYRGESGHVISGTHGNGRRAKVFHPGTRAEAEQVKANLKAGREPFHGMKLK